MPVRFGWGKFGLAVRLLAVGTLVWVGLWWLLDAMHSRDLAEVVDLQLSERVELKAGRDRVRLESLLQSHRVLAAMLAHDDRLGPEVAEGGGEAVVVQGLPRWFPDQDVRQIFPPVDQLVWANAAGLVRRIWSAAGGTPPPGIEQIGRLATPSAVTVADLGGVPYLVSAAESPGRSGGRLVVLSHLDRTFLSDTLGAFLDHGFALVATEQASGRIVAGSGDGQIGQLAALADLSPKYLIGKANAVTVARAGGGSGIVFSTLLARDKADAVREPLTVLERSYRTAIALLTSGMFFCVLVYIGWRIRGAAQRIAGHAARVFGAQDIARSGDELRDLEAETEHLVREVEKSRRALAAEEAERMRLLKEQMELETENERLGLLQAVTDELGVGVIRLTAEGPCAENQVMIEFATFAGGLRPFIVARSAGEDVVRLGEGEEARVFAVQLARQVDIGLLLVEDVTARRQAEENISIFAQFPAQNPHPVMRVNSDLVVTHANEASAGLLQTWRMSVNESVPDRWRNLFAEVLGTGLRREVEETVGDRVLSLVLVPLPAAAVVNVYGNDITARVAVERLLHMVNESLERRVHERTEALKAEITEHIRAKTELVAAKEQADLANRAKTEFLANVSHELRTPLNAIIGFSEVMASEMFGPLGSERYKGYVSDVLSSGRHLLTVITDILDIAKIEAGQMEFDISEIEPEEVVAAAVRIVESRADAGGLTLEIHLPDPVPTIWADRRRVLQILVNLLSNAVKFTPEGGAVEVWLLVENEELNFIVRDTGIGMSDDEVVVALLPFRQVDGTLSRRYEGTGLGLPLVRAFVELHGGTMEIVSDKGKGTSVTVRLPIKRAEGEILRAAGE